MPFGSLVPENSERAAANVDCALTKRVSFANMVLTFVDNVSVKNLLQLVLSRTDEYNP